MAKEVSEKKNYSVAINCLGLVFCVVLFCSCISFDIADAPSDYAWPHNSPASNWCGTVGAFFAYYLLYYIGPGVFVILITASSMLVVKLSGKSIEQLVLRVIGLGLVTVSVSTIFYLLLPHSVYAFPSGSGGIIGIAAGVFLRGKFAILGTSLILGSTFVAGMLLLADHLLFAFLRLAGIVFARVFGIAVPAWTAAKKSSHELAQIWQRLSLKQRREKPAGAVLTISQDLTTEKTTVDQEESESDKSFREPSGAVVSDVNEDTLAGATYMSKDYDDYTFPPLDLLAEPEYGYAALQEKTVKAKAEAMEKLLEEFNINAEVVAAETGPVITLFELALAAGIKVSQITNLANDMARALGAGAVRVVAPLPGKHTIGIEVPNSEKERVRIKDLIQLAGSKPKKMGVPLFLGKDSSGEALVSDLTTMPHLLIAGTTGSGKSVCINSIITTILLTKRPDEVKLILIDPKMVEMTAFRSIPHLMCPIVTETKRAEQILEWATEKMDERYSLFAEAHVKNITAYNRLGSEEIIKRFNPSSPEEEARIPKKLPYIVIIIDELADLMMTAAKEIENFVVRIAQKSRSIGIHLVLATQRPQATVVTGLIKSNLPSRISFRVAARMDSRIILDQNGAETLLGEGDMLFLKPGTSDLVRAQGTFVDETEVRDIVRHLKEIAEPQFHPELMQLNRIDAANLPRDEFFNEAVEIVLESERGSVSLLQRKLSIGYARASRIIETMAAVGILGEYKGSQAREVLMTSERWQRLREESEQADYQDQESEQEDAQSGSPEQTENEAEYISVKDESD